MTIDTTPATVIDLTAIRPQAGTAPDLSAAKAAKLRALITGKTEAERENQRLRSRIIALENEPVDARDHRMRHIWIAAARAATANDHCSEYDQIAEEVGGLTRDELREQGELDQTYRVRTLVTVEVFLSVDAYEDDNAVDKIDDLSRDDLRDLLENELGTAVSGITIESWDAREASVED